MTLQYPNTQQALPPRKGRLWLKIALGVVGALAVVAAVIGFLVINSVSAASEASNAAASKAAASESAVAASKAAQAALDRSTQELAAAAAKSLADAARADRVAMESKGWSYVSDFLYYASPTENYQCPGRYACSSMMVTTHKQPSGCPGGVSVHVSFLSSSGVSVYNSVRTTGALAVNEQGQLDFTDLSGNGTTMRVDSMTCY
ncbi:hypothetical protein SB659_18810 [Arthrobacter sp. SIMBA_036]|uniref:hypothetical protein n=1 Tax=Arthrobacter sp. SIMBA_036 TaxID=3085778 RepID=UPI00397BACC6